MLIAALETVTRAGSIALCADDECHARTGDPSRKHGERLPAEITDWMASHGRTLSEVDVFAVVCGPGSFTGLRVGIAVVQGLALASHRLVIGVPTLEALATSWLAAASDPTEVLVACLDGQRGEVFVAAWDTTGRSSVEGSSPLIDASVTTPDLLAARLAASCAGRAITIVGDGGRRYDAILRQTLPDARIVDATMPLAEAAVRLAAGRRDQAVEPHAIRPIYLRRPDAELARDRARRAAGTDRADTCVVRRVDPRENLTAVEALQRQTFSNPWGAEAIRWELENTDVARLYVMHDQTGALVAYCACWMVFDELHINSLAVDMERRRQGLARRLLEDVLREAAAAGAVAATLEVRSSNQAARGLYEGLGFKVEGLRRDYYQEPREDAVILWKRTLTGHTAGRAEGDEGQRAEGRGQKKGKGAAPK